MHTADAGSGVNYGTRWIRFAVMNTEATLEEWQARCLRNLAALNKVQLVLVIEIEQNRHSWIGGDKATGSRLNHILFEIYSKYLVTPFSTRIRDMTNIFSGIHFMHCKV